MTERDWHSHWQGVEVNGPQDLEHALRQVGKTTMGRPVPASQVELLVHHIRETLGLRRQDHCLDLGCGNGLLTSKLSRSVADVFGVDFSESLLGVARRHYAPSNVRYHLSDLTQLPEDLIAHGRFQRVWGCEVMQHLDAAGVASLFGWLGRQLAAGGQVLLCGIPERARLRAFYDTDERWAYYLERAAAGTEQIGTWWERETLSTLASAAGFEARHIAQPGGLYTAHYRFDTLLHRL